MMPNQPEAFCEYNASLCKHAKVNVDGIKK